MNNTIKKFKDRKALSIALLKGEKWKVVGDYKGYCFYKEPSSFESYATPFRFGTEEKNYDLDGWWTCADGEHLWEKINEF